MDDLIKKLNEINSEMENLLNEVPIEFIKSTKNKSLSKKLNDKVNRYSKLEMEKKEIEKKLSQLRRKQ